MKDNKNINETKQNDMIVVQPLDDTAEAAVVAAGEVRTDVHGGDRPAKKKKPAENGQGGKEAEQENQSQSNEVKALKEALQEQAREDEEPLSANFTLRKILGGDILTARLIRSQIWLVIIIVGFIIVYISNRYSVQQDLLEIDRLNKELKDAKYKALSSSSMLTEKCRESHVLELLKNNKDSVLKMPSQPPYIINVPEK